MAKLEIKNIPPRKVGRPKKFKTEREMINAMNKYFKECQDHLEPITQTGLAMSIGLDRMAMINYQGDERFSDAIKAARRVVEEFAEQKLYNNTGAAGPIFALKNLGWADKQEHMVGSPDGQPIGFNINVVDPKKDKKWGCQQSN